MEHLRYPNESTEYRAARNALLNDEIALRAQIETVAAKRRALPPGGKVSEDYVFERIGKNATCMIEPNSRGALDNFHTRERGAIDAAATAAMRASFDLLIMTLFSRLAANKDLPPSALQANLDSQRLNAVPTAHFHQHLRALFRCGRAISSAAGARRAAEPITSFREA